MQLSVCTGRLTSQRSHPNDCYPEASFDGLGCSIRPRQSFAASRTGPDTAPAPVQQQVARTRSTMVPTHRGHLPPIGPARPHAVVSQGKSLIVAHPNMAGHAHRGRV